MSEIVFFSDTHLGLDEPQKPRVSRPRRGPDFFANFHSVLENARRRRVSAVIHGGDLFFRSKVPQTIVDRVYADIHEFLESGIPFFLVPGNHERSRLPTSLFLAHPLLHVFDVPRTFLIRLNEGLLAIGGFPFHRDVEVGRFRPDGEVFKDPSVRNGVGEAFSGVFPATGLSGTDADFRFLCMHQTIEGAHVGPGNFVFRAGPDVIPISILPSGIDAIFAGHIHRRQEHHYRDSINGREIPILYPGSTERTSFAERDEPKGYFLIRVGRPEAAKNLSWEFQELPARPMVDLRVQPGLSQRELLCWLEEKLRDCPGRSIIRLRLPRALERAFPDCRGFFPPDAIIEYRPADKEDYLE